MLPAVAEVVRIPDAVVRLFEELPEPGVPLVAEPKFGVGESVVASRC